MLQLHYSCTRPTQATMGRHPARPSTAPLLWTVTLFAAAAHSRFVGSSASLPDLTYGLLLADCIASRDFCCSSHHPTHSHSIIADIGVGCVSASESLLHSRVCSLSSLSPYTKGGLSLACGLLATFKAVALAFLPLLSHLDLTYVSS